MGGILSKASSKDSWRTVDKIDDLATWGNNEKTKVMVMSPDVEKEKKFVEDKLKTNDKTNRITFVYFQVPDKTGIIKDKGKFLSEFKEKAPTVVILDYKHKTVGDQDKTLVNCPPGYAPPDSVPKILHSRGYLSEIVASGTNYLFLETCNVWYLEEKCILSSLVPVNGDGVEEQLNKAVDDGFLKNSADDKVLIITNGHGGTEKNGRVTPAGAVSCFSDMELLVYDFYKEDCEMVGVQAEPDICVYNGSKEVIDIKTGVPKPIPGPKPKSPNAKPTALMNVAKFDKIEFDILNISHFGIYDSSTSQTNINDLINYIKNFRPTLIVIGWCFSSNGDLAMALRRFGIFPKIIMENDMRIITKDPKAKLSDQQVEVLKMAALDAKGQRQFKDFHLAGPHGCGKTLLGVEITKMMMAQLIHEGKFINLIVMAKANKYQVPRKLKKKLEEDLKEIGHFYNDVQSNFTVLEDNKGLTIDQLEAEIKKEITELKKSVVGQQKDVVTIVLTDEVSTEVDKDKRERNFENMSDMGPTVHSIYCHSPLHNRPGKASTFTLHLPPTQPGKVYSTHLHTRYRNNRDILNFLQFFSKNVEVSPQDLLSSSNETAGASLPPALPDSPHPVLWLDCGWDWDDEMNKAVTVKMIERFVAEEGVGQINNQEISRLVLRDFYREVNDVELNSCDMGECEGIEADIVVAVGGLAAWRIEALSRARRQLVIITGTENIVREVYVKAEKGKLLVQKKIDKVPDYFKNK